MGCRFLSPIQESDLAESCILLITPTVLRRVVHRIPFEKLPYSSWINCNSVILLREMFCYTLMCDGGETLQKGDLWTQLDGHASRVRFVTWKSLSLPFSQDSSSVYLCGSQALPPPSPANAIRAMGYNTTKSARL